MNSIRLDRSAYPNEFDAPQADDSRLRRMPFVALWRLWWRVGRALLAVVLGTLSLWLARARERDDLSRLEPHMLRDIGVTEEQAGKEWKKAFWIP